MSTEVEERFRRFRHDISNPLAAILAEAQLLLLRESELDAETAQSVKEIEALARRMRDMLKEVR
jgi:signal transduction histidine kinase